MPISKAAAQDVTRAFVRDYPGALAVAYRFRETVVDLYGPNAAGLPTNVKGGYSPTETPHAGRVYAGRVDVPLQGVSSPQDLLSTLRHEVLGHYGINTFAPAEKRALLDSLTASREEPSLSAMWADIDQRYAGRSMDVRAEEVFALQCQGIEPGQHRDATAALQKGERSLRETCITRDRAMQAADLANIALMVAQGLQDRSRTQQTFAQSAQPLEQRGAVTAGQIARATQAMPLHFDQLAKDSRYTAHTHEERGAAAFFKGLASAIAQDEGRAFNAQRFDAAMAVRSNAARLELPADAKQVLDSTHRPTQRARDDGGRSL